MALVIMMSDAEIWARYERILATEQDSKVLASTAREIRRVLFSQPSEELHARVDKMSEALLDRSSEREQEETLDAMEARGDGQIARHMARHWRIGCSKCGDRSVRGPGALCSDCQLSAQEAALPTFYQS